MASPASGTLEEVVQAVIDQLDQPALLVDPSIETIRTVVEISTTRDTPPIRVLASDDLLKRIRDRFPIASKAADLHHDGRLELRTAMGSLGNQLLITETSVTVLVTAGDTAVSLTTQEESFVTTAYEHFTSEWDDAEDFQLRTPPLSQVRQTLREEFGDAFGDDFDAALEVSNNDAEFDVVALLLLLSAKHKELLYDISKVAEDTGIASKATFSRGKTELEEMEVIGTEKVPGDIGRPRLRLTLASEQLQDATSDELLLRARESAA